MTLTEARRQLSRKEMEKVTERALATGPFTVDKVRRLGSRVEVSVSFTNTDKKKLIILDPLSVRTL